MASVLDEHEVFRTLNTNIP